MTAPPDFVREELRRRRERHGPLRNGAVVTAAGVAAGFVVASMTLSPVPTPGNVVTAYVEARFARDWSAAWDLLCRPAQAAHDGYAAYADVARDEMHFAPRDVDVSTGHVHRIPGLLSAVAVPLTVESEDLYYKDWALDGNMILVHEGDELRVCERSVWSG
jgi:hypothetical protein